MVIRNRWGILSFFGFGIGVAMTLGLVTVVALIYACVAAVNWALARWLYPRLDKPRPVTMTRQLPQPYMRPDGNMQTHEVVQALDPEGRPLWETLSSSFSSFR